MAMGDVNVTIPLKYSIYRVETSVSLVNVRLNFLFLP